MAVKFFFVFPPQHSSSSFGADLRWFLGCLLTILLCPFKILWWPIEPLIVKVFSGFRYWFRYREKKSQSLKNMTEFAMDSVPRDTKDLDGHNESSIVTIVELYNKSQIVYERRRSILEIVLSCYSPALDSITSGLHYIDIVNLGLVSKTVRDALNTKSHAALRRASCVSGTESACWSCGKQVCRVYDPYHHLPSNKANRSLTRIARSSGHLRAPSLPSTSVPASSSAPNASTSLAATASSPKGVLSLGLSHVPDTTRIVPQLESYVGIALRSILTAFL